MARAYGVFTLADLLNDFLRFLTMKMFFLPVIYVYYFLSKNIILPNLVYHSHQLSSFDLFDISFQLRNELK